MCGYQEVLTDPSYSGQIVVMTAPQIGNYGISPFDDESARPQVAGFVVRDLSRPEQLAQRRDAARLSRALGLPGLFEVDTRAITRLLRERGAQRGVLGAGSRGADGIAATAPAPGLGSTTPTWPRS